MTTGKDVYLQSGDRVLEGRLCTWGQRSGELKSSAGTPTQ